MLLTPLMRIGTTQKSSAMQHSRRSCPAVSVSEPFEDGLALLRAAERRGMEEWGMVSKRRDAPYRSGECRDWRKVKKATWLGANRKRWLKGAKL